MHPLIDKAFGLCQEHRHDYDNRLRPVADFLFGGLGRFSEDSCDGVLNWSFSQDASPVTRYDDLISLIDEHLAHPTRAQ